MRRCGLDLFLLFLHVETAVNSEANTVTPLLQQPLREGDVGQPPHNFPIRYRRDAFMTNGLGWYNTRPTAMMVDHRVHCTVTVKHFHGFDGVSIGPEVIKWTCEWDQVCCGTRCCSSGSIQTSMSLLTIGNLLTGLLPIIVLFCCVGYCLCSKSDPDDDTSRDTSVEPPLPLAPPRLYPSSTPMYPGKTPSPPSNNGTVFSTYPLPDYSARDPNYYLPGYPPPYPPAYPQCYPAQSSTNTVQQSTSQQQNGVPTTGSTK